MSDKTEEPTPKRLADARERGEVATSRDAVAVAAIAAGLAALWASRDDTARALSSLAAPASRAAAAPDPLASVPPGAALALAGAVTLRALAPPLAAACAAGALVGALFTGFLFAPTAALPKLERLDPSRSLGRLGQGSTWVEPLLKSAAALLLAWLALRAAPLDRALRLSGGGLAARAEPAQALLGETLRAVLARGLGFAVAWAALDALYRRHAHQQQLRMSRDEVTREQKDSEGDPHTRSAREQLRHELLEEAALDAVRKASFVVTNPTHYAVALTWDEDTMSAPALVARGSGPRARRIIEAAREAGVPVLRDAPLARTLHALDEGAEVPEALYDALAAVVSFLADGGEPERYEP